MNKPLHFRIIVPSLFLLFVLITVGQSFTVFFLAQNIRRNIDQNMGGNTQQLHNFTVTLARESTRNYLRGLAAESRAVLEPLHQEVLEGKMTLPQAQARAASLLVSHKIGDSGYLYGVDSSGTLVFHPVAELAGTRIIEHDFVREQIKSKTGYLEYEWKNPGESKPRSKRVYYRWVEEFDWLIATSVYLDTLYDDIGRVFIVSPLIQLGTMLALGFLLYLVSLSITRPLRDLTALCTDGEGGDSYPADNTRNEITLVRRSLERYITKLEADKEELKEANEKIRILAQFTDENLLPVIRLNSRGFCSYLNNAALDAGFQNLLGEDYFLKPAWDQKVSDVISGTMAGEENINGKTYIIQSSPVSGIDENYLLFLDVTNQRKFETLQAVWNRVIRNSREGIVITDMEGTILEVNESFTRITGYEAREALGKNTRILKSDRHPTEFYALMWKSLIETGTWSGEIWNRRKMGEAYSEWLSISAFTDASSGERKYIAIFHDVSDLRQKEEMLERINNYDVLTDLPNRILFQEILGRSFKLVSRNNAHCAVILLDVDGMKRINDELGYPRGDEFLQILSQRLVGSVRDEDTVARLSGDEFAILIPRLSEKSHYFDFVERIRSQLSPEFILDGSRVKPSVSMGIAIFPGDGGSPQEILKMANTALERTKRNRRGAFSLFDPRFDETALKRRIMEGHLENALEKGEFELHFQPKVSLVKSRVVGFEALLRWNHPERYTPDVFIPLAESTGAIMEIGQFVIREACRFLTVLKKNGWPEVHVGVNISARQFKDPLFESHLVAIAEEAGIDNSCLDLEITESIAASEIAGVYQGLNQLAHRGFTISIDDFGTGYSSLNYLQDLTFDSIKIDKSFIDKITLGPSGISIVKAIISLGKALDKTVVAEGVETADQLSLLEKEGCDLIQGYFFSRPLPEKDVLPFLRGWDWSHFAKPVPEELPE